MFAMENKLPYLSEYRFATFGNGFNYLLNMNSSINKVENTTDEMNYNEGMEKQEMKEEDHGKATFNDGKPPRSPADDNTLRERSTSHER